MEIKCQLDATDDFYCRSYGLLNMFRVPLCPSSGAREYYTEGRCLWYLVLWCGAEQPANRTHNPQLHTIPTTWKPKHQIPQAVTFCIILSSSLMMGIMVPETCSASNTICNKNHLLHLVGILFPHINDDARSESFQINFSIILINLRFHRVERHVQVHWHQFLSYYGEMLFCI